MSDSGDMILQPIKSIPSAFKPMLLEGDILAMSDENSETMIYNWKTGAHAILHHTHDTSRIWRLNICLQVVFAYQSILVVRARSVDLYSYPLLRTAEEGVLHYTPIAFHSFGWVDGVSIQMAGQKSVNVPLNTLRRQPISILVRGETRDPWRSDILTLNLYTMNPNPEYLPCEPTIPRDKGTDEALVPYIFPPVLASRVGSFQGAVSYTNAILGNLGTAIWIQPRNRTVAGLYWSTEDEFLREILLDTQGIDISETLVTAVFPGPLAPSPSVLDQPSREGVVDVESKALYPNERNNWSSLDYDESVGRVVIGSRVGHVVILDM